jgi:hypothetical protein
VDYVHHKPECKTKQCANCACPEWLHDAAEDIDEDTCIRGGQRFIAGIECTCGLSTLLAEAAERAHSAPGVAELATKHRDEAEAEHQRLREESDMDYIAAALHCSPTRDAIGAAIQELYRRFDAEAEPPTPPVEDAVTTERVSAFYDPYPAILDVLDKHTRGWNSKPTTRENIAEVIDAICQHQHPQEDAVTRAKLEEVFKDGWHAGVSAVDGDGVCFRTSTEDWADYLYTHLKGSPDAE